MRISRLYMPAVTLAGALALAGCGGGSTPPAADPPAGLKPGEASKPIGGKVYTCAENRTENCDFDPKNPPTKEEAEAAGITITDAPPPPPPAPTALQSAVDEAGKASAAETAADALHEAAADAGGKLMAHDVNGSSAAAEANAMTVLAARALITAERDKAKAAVDELTKLHMAATGDAKARIKVQLDRAQADHDDIAAMLDATKDGGKALKTAEDAARDGAKTGADDAGIARHRADQVAMAMMKALQNTNGTARSLGTPVPAPSANNLLVSNASTAPEGFTVSRAGTAGMTFEQITGDESLDVTTVMGDDYKHVEADGTVTTNTELVSAISNGVGDTNTANQIDGNAGLDAAYKGIPGRLLCVGTTDCTFGTDGKVTAGAVVFYPNDAAALWTQATFGADYKALMNAATYGYWLTEADAIALHAASLSTGGAAPVWTDPKTWATPGDGPDEATYRGKAGGYSYRETGEGDDARMFSGEFTADVELEAEFGTGADATLEGSISGFEGVGGSDHVNASWYVGLAEKTSAANNFTDGMVTDSKKAGMEDATSGSWSAAAYGEAGRNPAGLVGAFSAEFDDGNAAGVYHAGKE